MTYSILNANNFAIHWDDYSDKHSNRDIWSYIKLLIGVAFDKTDQEGNMVFLQFEFKLRLLERDGLDIDTLEDEEILFSYIGVLKYVVFDPLRLTISDLEEIQGHAYTTFVSYFNSRKSGNIKDVNAPIVRDIKGQLLAIHQKITDHYQQ